MPTANKGAPRGEGSVIVPYCISGPALSVALGNAISLQRFGVVRFEREGKPISRPNRAVLIVGLDTKSFILNLNIPTSITLNNIYFGFCSHVGTNISLLKL